MTSRYLIAAVFLSISATASQAQTVLSGDHVVTGNLCAGPACSSPLVFGEYHLWVNDITPNLRFNDTSDFPGTSTRDWAIIANEIVDEFLSIQDLGTGNTVFTVEGVAPENSLYIASDGQIGLGTMLPDASMHIVDHGFATELRLTAGISADWMVSANEDGFAAVNAANETLPFRISNDAPDDSVVVNDLGYLGLGTKTPQAQLELASDASFNFFRITAAGAAVNDSVDITFTGGPLGTGQLRYNIVDGDNQEMSLDADGNMVLDGTLTTAGPTCAGGCDRVFDAGYALPTIEEHASEMFASGFLPSIGATVPHAPVNLSERQGRIINSLEHAHIYIDQLHDENREQAAQIAALMARLDAIEAK